MNLSPPLTPSALPGIAAALRAGDVQRARTQAVAALEAGERHPLVLQVAAEARQAQGRADLALVLLEEAARAAPSDPPIQHALAQLLAAMGEPRQAVPHFEAALAVRPDHPPTIFALGQALEQVGDLDAAAARYEDSARQPGYAEPRAALAFLAVNSGQADKARAWAQSALQIAPSYRPPQVVLASADLLDARYGEAEATLRGLLATEPEGSSNRGALQKLLGDALHGQGRYPEAWEAYRAGNRALHDLYLRRTPGGDGLARRQAQALFAQFAAVDPSRWQGATGPDQGGAPAVRGHAFLVGFPRSGTTLLEQALARHPDIVGLEERPTLAAPLDGLLTGALSMEQLAAMPAPEAERLRAIYWERVAALTAGEHIGRVVIDKMPLNLLLLPLIQRLFPQARIILAIRDPRDVVLSCFRQRFLLTPAMAEFVTVESAARYYDAVMTLAQSYRQALPLAVHVHCYEDMVADFDGRVGDVLRFLELDWRDEVRNFALPQRALVNTPSARQIGRGLNSAGLQQWRRYAAFMDEAERVLAPWLTTWGYAAG